MRESFRQYRQAFALSVMSKKGVAMTAADVSEHIQVVATMDGHPDECWRQCDPMTMSGVLRALENDGLVKRNGDAKDRRAGRKVPLYVLVDPSCEHSQPEPPDDDEAPQASPAPTPQKIPNTELTIGQAYVLLEIGDEFFGTVGRFMRDIQELQAKARRKLADAGIEVRS